MPLLQPRLNLKVSQRQILTPGLMQMVSVLALNKLELTEMINAEMVENPVLEEIDESVPTLDEIGGREAMRDRVVEEAPVTPKDPFEEIDFGSYFQDYLDPGFRTSQEYEELDKPSFEQFLSQPTTLTDHLLWQLGSMTLEVHLREAAEFLIGNLDDDGYLGTTLEELADVFAGTEDSPQSAQARMRAALTVIQRLDPAGIGALDLRDCLRIQLDAQLRELELVFARHPEELQHRGASCGQPEHTATWNRPSRAHPRFINIIADRGRLANGAHHRIARSKMRTPWLLAEHSASQPEVRITACTLRRKPSWRIGGKPSLRPSSSFMATFRSSKNGI